MSLKRWITAGVGTLAIAAGALWFYTSTKAATGVNERELLTVQRVDFPLLVSATGILEATRSVSIGPPQIRRENRFKLTRVVDEGTEVSEGDFVMEFDSSDVARRLRDETANFQSVQEEYQKKRSDSDIQLRQARLSLEQAKADYEKLENKLSQQAEVESAIVIEETRIQRDAAKKNVEFLEKKLQYQEGSAQLNLQISRSNESYYRQRMDTLMDAIDSLTVRAPISGVVIYKRDWNNEPKQIGSYVFSMESVMEIPDLSTIRAKLLVDEVDAGKVKPGQEANIIVDAVQGKTFRGKVASVSSILKQATFDRPLKIVEAFVELEGSDFKQLRPAMSVKAQVKVGQHTQALVIPLSSIQEREGRSFVQMWRADRKEWEWREIQLKTNDGLTAVVESGLQTDEKIRVKPKA